MLKISFTNAEVSDHGYGLSVFIKSVRRKAIIKPLLFRSCSR